MDLRNLKQLRALSDPLKLRILHAFANEPRTTLQVAKALRLAPTALYRHVNALWKLGLLRVVREQRKRGTMERTFQAVAREFGVAPGVLGTPSKARAAARALFHEAEQEFLAACPPDGAPTGPMAPFAVGVRIVGTRAEVARLRRAVMALAQRLAQSGRRQAASAGTLSASALLVFTPALPPGEA